MFINKTRNIINLNHFNDDAIALISKVLVVIKFGDDNLRFTLSEALTTQEDLDLDDLVANFNDNDIALAIPKIIGLAKPDARDKHFTRILYTSTKDLMNALIPKRVADKGEVKTVEWYSTIDATLQSPTDLVLKVQISYVRMGSGLALYRDVIRTWINEDGSDNEETITSRKYYTVNPGDTISEGVKRRTLLVENIQVPTLTAMTQALVMLGYSETSALLKGRSFMDDYELEFNNFKKNSSSITDAADPNFGKKSVIVKLEEEARPDVLEWLDSSPPLFGGVQTIRQYLTNEFDI